MKAMSPSAPSPVVDTRDAWLRQRQELLREEKALTRQREALAEKRRQLPWVKLDKTYRFETSDGAMTLSDLFDGRSQLAVYHFMFGPGWETGCKSCSFIADHLVPMEVHLNAKDVTLLVVSRAPLSEIFPFQQRMGWPFRWVSSHGSDFNFDFHVSFSPEDMARKSCYYNYQLMEFPSDEAPGFSSFAKDASGNIYHTYSAYSRGVEPFMGTYEILDLVPMGRNENPASWNKMDWVHYHDSYPLPTDVDTKTTL